MSAAALLLRIIMATIIVLVLGVIAVFSFTIIEPFQAAFGEPPTSLGWGSPAATTVAFAGVGFLALLLTVVIWLIVAPIRNDRRQGVR